MSTIEVNKITPVSGGTATAQVGESGDTIYSNMLVRHLLHQVEFS
jgi:hypothetical protein